MRYAPAWYGELLAGNANTDASYPDAHQDTT